MHCARQVDQKLAYSFQTQVIVEKRAEAFDSLSLKYGNEIKTYVTETVL